MDYERQEVALVERGTRRDDQQVVAASEHEVVGVGWRGVEGERHDDRREAQKDQEEEPASGFGASCALMERRERHRFGKLPGSVSQELEARVKNKMARVLGEWHVTRMKTGTCQNRKKGNS